MTERQKATLAAIHQVRLEDRLNFAADWGETWGAWFRRERQKDADRIDAGFVRSETVCRKVIPAPHSAADRVKLARCLTQLERRGLIERATGFDSAPEPGPTDLRRPTRYIRLTDDGQTAVAEILDSKRAAASCDG